MASEHDQTIDKELPANLERNEEMLPLADAAKSRSEADWLIGINSSRGLTSFNSRMGGFQITPCGRVQTPTLSMIIHREKKINDFVPHTYYQLFGMFESDGTLHDAKWFDPNFKKDPNDTYAEKKSDRIFDEKKAIAITKLVKGQLAKVSEQKKTTTENPPLLYDLTTLQKEANSRYGFSARGTLATAQSLYERHKLITYPRTDARFLPNDYLPNVKSALLAIQESKNESLSNLKQFSKKIFEKDYLKNSPRVFNDKKISDHHAIIPSTKSPGKLSEPELKIYSMIASRMIAIFFPPAKLEKVERIFEVKEENFKSEGKVLVVPGYREVFGNIDMQNLLKPIEQNNEIKCKDVEKHQDETKPPARFTEASILSAMEGAGKKLQDEEMREAMKNRGLGTPATRASILEKLVLDKYLVKEGRELLPTSKAFELFSLIEAMKIETLNSPELTGDWEHKLSLIESGKLQREIFMDEISKNAQHIINQIKGYDEDAHKKPAEFSPVNGEEYYEYLTRYANKDKSIIIRKIIGGRQLSNQEVCELIKNKKIGPFDDFRSKRGKPFVASIVLNENNKVSLIFPSREIDQELDISTAELVGHSYLDGSPVYKLDALYVSKSFIEKDEQGFSIPKFLLGKEIGEENIKKMISGEKTDLIKGFRSAKTKRLFDAFLEINKTGKLSFSFPERKKKKKS